MNTNTGKSENNTRLAGSMANAVGYNTATRPVLVFNSDTTEAMQLLQSH